MRGEKIQNPRRRCLPTRPIPASADRLEPRRLLSSNYFISPTGNDFAQGTDQAPWLTIQRAADVAEPGDTVTVRRGEYQGFDLQNAGSAAAPITFKAETGVTINV